MKWNEMRSYIDYTNIQSYKVTDKCCEELVLKAHVYGINTVLISPASIKSCLPHLSHMNLTLAVSIGYPSGAYTIESKVSEINELIETYPAISEFYVVLSLGMLLDNKIDLINAEVAALKAVCQNKTLKLVTEIEVLTDEQMQQLCQICGNHQIDYVVTSTGFKPYEVKKPSLPQIKKFLEFAQPHVNVIVESDISSMLDANELLHLGAHRLLLEKDIWMAHYEI